MIKRSAKFDSYDGLFALSAILNFIKFFSRSKPPLNNFALLFIAKRFKDEISLLVNFYCLVHILLSLEQYLGEGYKINLSYFATRITTVPGGTYDMINCTFETPGHIVDVKDVIKWLGNDVFFSRAKEDL